MNGFQGLQMLERAQNVNLVSGIKRRGKANENN